LPFTVKVKAAPPALAAVGLRSVVAGAGLLIVKVWILDEPPPGVELYTVTEAVPAVAISVAAIAAVNCVDDTNVVVRFAPFQRTIDPGTKPVPLTASANEAPPAVPEAGLRLVVIGAGLLIVKISVLEVRLEAGMYTVTEAAPDAAMSAAATAAVNCVEDTNVVMRFEPFH
jgi:hypothetical protein